MEDRPFASVIVVTRNRAEFLEMMLAETRRQLGYENIQVIVANDGGRINIEDRFKELFPEINFINFFENLGLIKLRNDLFKIANAEFVFFLDDDSWFEQRDAVINAVEILKDHPDVGILSFRIKLPNGEMIPSYLSDGDYYETGSFIGCAHLIRKSLFDDSNIYDGDYFRQGEERDLSIKCIENGHIILQVNSIIVYHLQAGLGRDHQFIHGYAFRNELFFYIKYFPTILCFFFIIKCIASHTIYCFRKRWFRAYFFGLSKFILDFPSFFRKRRPVRFSTAKKYILLNSKEKKQNIKK